MPAVWQQQARLPVCQLHKCRPMLWGPRRNLHPWVSAPLNQPQPHTHVSVRNYRNCCLAQNLRFVWTKAVLTEAAAWHCSQRAPREALPLLGTARAPTNCSTKRFAVVLTHLPSLPTRPTSFHHVSLAGSSIQQFLRLPYSFLMPWQIHRWNVIFPAFLYFPGDLTVVILHLFWGGSSGASCVAHDVFLLDLGDSTDFLSTVAWVLGI